jgi:hypothetical protein
LKAASERREKAGDIYDEVIQTAEYDPDSKRPQQGQSHCIETAEAKGHLC